MQVSMVTESEYSLVVVEGGLDASTVDAVVDTVAVVPDERPLIVDLRGVTRVDGRAAAHLSFVLSARAAQAHVAVVSADVDVTVRFVLAGADARMPFVGSLDDAIGLVTGVVARA